MKTIKFLSLLAISAVLTSCSQEKTPERSDVPVVVATVQVMAPEYSNPILIYGTDFGTFFQALYKTGKFDQMLKFTSSKSIDKFGRDKVLAFYKDMDFAYDIQLKSKNDSADVTTLNYTAGIMATRSMLRMDVIVENDSCKILLRDIKNLR